MNAEQRANFNEAMGKVDPTQKKEATIPRQPRVLVRRPSYPKVPETVEEYMVSATFGLDVTQEQIDEAKKGGKS